MLKRLGFLFALRPAAGKFAPASGGLLSSPGLSRSRVGGESLLNGAKLLPKISASRTRYAAADLRSAVTNVWRSGDADSDEAAVGRAAINSPAKIALEVKRDL